MSRTPWRGTTRRFAGVIALALVLPILPIGMQAAGARTPAADFGLTFNGTTQYATAGSETDGSYSNLGASQFTIEGWIRKTGTGDDVGTSGTGNGGLTGVGLIPLITKGRFETDNSNVDMNYFVGLNASGRLVADFEDNTDGGNHPADNTTGTVIPTGQWTHIAVTMDGAEWRFYVNGNLDRTAIPVTGNNVPRFDSIQRFALGTAQASDGTPLGFFQGSMDEVRGWNVARSQSQIRSTINDEVTGAPTLIGRWGLNQGSGPTATNSGSAGSNANLSLVASPHLGYRLRLREPWSHPERVESVRDAGAGSNLHASQFTLEMWIRRSGTSAGTTTGNGGFNTAGEAIPLITKGRGEGEIAGQDVNYFFGIHATSGKLIADFEEAQSRGRWYKRRSQPSGHGEHRGVPNVWHHVAVTYDGTDWKFYLDGVPDGSPR